MVKVAAPLMSMEASGSLGGALVFAKWKGRPYARSLVKPSNPRTQFQVGIRAMLKFLAQQWKPNKAEIEGSWIDAAKASNISPFNAYIQANMRAWREGMGVSKLSPPAYETTPALCGLSASGGIRHAELGISAGGGNSAWGYAIYRDTVDTGHGSWANCIAVLDGADTPLIYEDAPLAAGTYYYTALKVYEDGILGLPPSTEWAEAVVT